MKIVDVSCPACGSKLEITDTQDFVTCEYCGKQFFVDDEVKRSETRIDHHYSAEDAENAGYQFEKGRMRARQEAEWEEAAEWARFEARQREQEKGCIKIFLWIFLFPVMVLYWLATTERLSKKTKIIIAVIILAVWALGSYNKPKIETYSAESPANMERAENPISYDALQELFLRINDSISPDELQTLLQEDAFQSIVWRKRSFNGYDKYILAYSKDVVNDVRGAEGDYLAINFDSRREDRFMYARYFKQDKYAYAILFRYGYCNKLGSSDPENQEKWGYYYYKLVQKPTEKGPPYFKCLDGKAALHYVMTGE